MPETVQTFAKRVREKDSSYQGVDDARVVYDVLNKAPIYRQKFLPQERRNNIFGTIFKEALLGFAETGSKTVEGIGFNLASMIASETMTEEEFNQSDKAGKMSYQDYKEHNDERVEVENKAIAHAQNVGDFFRNLAPEDTAGPQGTFEILVGQVARGLGQFAGYAAAGTAATAIGTAAGSPVGGAAAATASIYTIATMNRQMEFIDDAERTLGKSITEMSADEKDKITKGSLGYGAITGALDATVFKYVAGMPNALKSVLQKAKIGKPVSEKLFKSALSQAAGNALKRGAAEGLQESIGDGMTLDIMAKNLYDEERKFITGDALGRRIMEFTVGGLVGGIASGIGDSGKLMQGKAITPEGQQRLNDETDRILEAMPSVDREKIAKAILDGDPNPEITVFDLNGTPIEAKVTSYEQDGKIEVETKDGIKQVLGEGDLVEYNTRRPDYNLRLETETGKPDQKLSDLSSQELDKAIKEREAYAEENAQSEDPLFVQGVNNALGDVFALRAEKRRRARLEREAGRPVEPKKPKKPAQEVDQTGGQTFTVTYVSKESGLKTTTEVVASSLEEAETQFRNLYKDDISRDGAVEVTVKGKPEPAPTEPVPTEPVPEPKPETAPQKPIREQIKEKFKSLRGFGIRENETEIRISKAPAGDVSKFDKADIIKLIDDYADATGKRVIISLKAAVPIRDIVNLDNYETLGSFGSPTGYVRLPEVKERPELDVDTTLDPIPEEKFEEPELSLVESEINEANVIKFITQKFGNIFNSDLLTLRREDRKIGTKLKVKFVSKAPKNDNAIAFYSSDHTITFYVDRLMEQRMGTRGIIKTVRHELMHAIAPVVAFKQGKSIHELYQSISKSLTPAQRQLMDELYARRGYNYSSGQHRGRGAEFFRAVMEEFAYGIPSEENIRNREILKSGNTAFQKIVTLVKDIQRYISNFFKGDVLKNPEVAVLFIDSVNLLSQLDPNARPVNQKLVDLVRSRISPNTDTLYDNVNDYTKDMKEYVDEQLESTMGIPQGNLLKPIIKFSKEAARKFLSEIETGTGGIAQLMKNRPKLRQASIDNVRRRFGKTVRVYRVYSLQKGKEMRPDTVVSTTHSRQSMMGLNSSIPVRLLNTRTFEMTTADRVFRAYDIPVERVIADVGLLGQAAADTLNQKTIRGKRDKVTIEDILDTIDAENELIVDVSGIKPIMEVKFDSDNQEASQLNKILLFNGQNKDYADSVEDFLMSDLEFKSSVFYDKDGKFTQDINAILEAQDHPKNKEYFDAARKVIQFNKDFQLIHDAQVYEDAAIFPKKKHEPLPKEGTPKGMGFASRYLIPVGQLLGNIHSDLEKAFHKYIQVKDEKILIRHRMALPFANKMKELKKSNEGDYIKLWALISFSPNATESRYDADEQNQFIEERDALLKKYGMYNEYLATRKVLDNVMNDALDTGIQIGFLEQYFPRYLNPEGRAGFLRKYAGIDRRTFAGEIEAENKRRAELKATRYVLKLNGEDIGTFGRRSAAATARARKAAELGVTEQDIEIVAMELPSPQPPIQEGSIQEVQFIQKLLNDPKYAGKGKSNFQKQRVIEKISEEDTQFYLDPMQAYNKYITQMTTTIETAKFAGLNKPDANAPSKDKIIVEYDPTSELGRLIAKLSNENPDPEFQSLLYEYLPQIYRGLMAHGAQENQVLAWMRQFSYFSLLVEVTSTMSQLYDLPFIMYDNGFLPTLRSMIGNKEFNVSDYLDQNRMIEQNFGGDKDAVLMKITSEGLRLTGFRKLDQIMKNTTMDANYKRYMRLARELNLSYLNPDGSIKEEHKNKFNKKQRKFLSELNQFLSPEITNPNEPMEMLVALRTQPEQRSQRQQDLIKSTLVAKLFQNQPLSELRMPFAARTNPNMRMWYTMKSFMIVQVNTARNLAFNKIARGLNQLTRTGGKEGGDELAEGMANLLTLMFYFVMLGIPIDFVKDVIAGRVGYISDYTFNSMVRVAGVNKYFLYKGRNEGYGTAILNFAMPAPLAAVIDTGNKMTAAFEKEGTPTEKLFDSGILKQLPLYDTLHYVVPELREYKRERERFFMKRRMRQQQEGFLGLFEQIEPRPTQITRDLLGI